MMQKAFKKTLYRFTEIPGPSFGPEAFGIYVHVPFCLSKCSFCPFYKEIFTEEWKTAYLASIAKEINDTKMEGRARWVYFGGGTPNTLSTDELGEILGSIRNKVQIDVAGVELLPALLTPKYLKSLAGAGFTKVSIGVESFAPSVIANTGRRVKGAEHTEEMIKISRSLGLFVNTDMMVGLPRQDAGIFMEDINRIGSMLPDQVTIYPFMTLRGLRATEPGMSPREQFLLIEQAGKALAQRGYERKAVWTFAFSDDVYDSSRDELTEDYAGFGPSAFSTYGTWKVVNPELDAYVKSMGQGQRVGFVASKGRASDGWRRFARMIYDLRLNGSDLPFGIRLFTGVLRLCGHGKRGMLTRKGVMFAHEISKTVVESLPFPLQNPGCVENYDEYLSYKEDGEVKRDSMSET